ncbi:dTDP-4-dehydrorhamnose reductase [Methylobacillus gramineus]|uniref:dTDP-4-dehydrorhamnose reductase n=1 Tax=Methylobacillus gramineus TaxID=755169 RepID=UPI001CFF78A3|nr:dTDP-4-dehydrorhamnose reductase [Methylobacillus gramineus]MCB5183703.1 dTDP-4-dehydrorhamnose reductase [Methylobacillus gramineus]
MKPRYSKILLTGAYGQVGHALINQLHSLGEVVALGREQLNLADEQSIRQAVQSLQPDLIVNAAAYTAVDQAETETELAHAINSSAPKILAQEANRLGAWLLHYSTDYVFDGRKLTAYVEEDITGPLNQYGASKLAGEQAVQAFHDRYLILRTSWVFGNHGANFYKTILKLAQQKTHLNIVADQIGAPTHSLAIAKASAQILRHCTNNQSGLYHISNAGHTSWHGFAVAIIEQYLQLQAAKGWDDLALNTDGLQAITAAEYPVKALRPANSQLNNAKLKQAFGIALPDWRNELHLALEHYAD